MEIPKYRSFDIDNDNDIKIVETIINSKMYKMNKTFLITGASSGLGEIFSKSILDIAKTIIAVGRNKNKLVKLKKKLTSSNLQ